MELRLAGLPSEALSAALVADFPLAVLMLDREGRVLLWNRAATRLTGWTEDEVLGQVLPFVPLESREAFLRRLGEAFEGGELSQLAFTRRRKDGSVMHLNINRTAIRDRAGNVVGVLGVLTEITDLARDAAERARKDINFRALIERAPDAIAVHRLGVVLYTNPKLLSLLGYDSPEELVGLRLIGFIHPDDREKVTARLRQVSEWDREVPPLEERFRRKDGSYVDVEVIGLPVLFDGQAAILSHARDITERKRLRAELAMADRLASVGRLAAGVGHEINNPLTYVIGSLDRLAQKLRERPGEIEGLLDLVAAASHGVDRVRQIARDLAVLSRPDSEERAAVDIRRVLDTCVNVAEHHLRNRARIVRAYEPLPEIASSESRLGQVFLNLLLNAAQAIPEGDADANAITIVARQEGNAVVVLIHDTGAGIPAAVRDRVFDPFFTTKPPGVGSGLGLSICRSIVTSLGGEITVESDGQTGTTARVALPLGEASPAFRAPAPEPISTKGPRRRVLVIDDEPRVAAILQSAVAEAHDTEVACGGRLGLESLRRGDAFDVILCDLMMEGMSGQAFYAAVKAEFPGVEQRIAFVTGGAFSREAQLFLASVPNPCLGKPFDLEAVFRTIRDL